MFYLLATAVSFVPDENGNIATLDSPLLQIESGDLPTTDYGWAAIKMLLTLIVLVALFGATLWFLRRLIRQRLERGTGIQAIRVLEKKMISPKTMLYVLEIEGKRLVVAESQLEVRQLTILPEMNRSSESFEP